ncbi:MAG TPA: extracellular solute-binding protein [Candidatus Binatia bacterium]|jgi:ABC-type Fe3+ transport system substrate-binding protein|nr:extracellular solute-binding protein [Candidatus Binatia bacterium]
MKTLLLALVGTAFLWQPVLARPRLALEMQLLEGAMRERKLVLYTTTDLPQGIQVVHDFVQKYPFLDLEIHPLEAEALVTRVLNESRTATPRCDVLIGGGGVLQPLFEENLLASYQSLERGAVSEALNDSEGYWSGYYVNSYVLGYNTVLVKEEDIPKSYDDLLDPRWKGNRIAIDSTAHGLLRGLAPAWGEDKAVTYLKRLASQQPLISRASISAVETMHNGNVSLVIARAPVIQGYKDKFRSPIEWISLEPTIAQIDALMVSAQSPHPNAARLFVNFALSRVGQGALAGVQQIPVRRDMEANSKLAAGGHKWFVERPDQHVNFSATVKRFREIFGIR